MTQVAAALLLLSSISVSAGCTGPARAQLSRNDPATAASKAIELYDRDGDGKLSADELRESPALLASARRLDRNGDGFITLDEIQARFDVLEDYAKFVGLDVVVTSRGRPLVGAELTFTPEPFMGEGYPTFSGTTVEGGGCPLQCDGRQLPGVPSGFYQVKIVHPSQGIDVVRGVEIADDTIGNRLHLAL